MRQDVTARTAGWFYMLNFAFAPSMYFIRKLVHLDNAPATATNIFAHVTLFHAGFAGILIAVAAYLVVTALFYVIFKPVNRNLALVASLMSVAGCIVLAVGSVFYYAPFPMLVGVHSSSGTTLEQAQNLVLTFFRLYGQFYNASLVFFAFYCILIGNLAYRSTFVPRILGVLMMIAGLGWLTFIWPPFALAHFPLLLLSAIGEIGLPLWFIFKGIENNRWEEQSAATRLAAYRPT